MYAVLNARHSFFVAVYFFIYVFAMTHPILVLRRRRLCSSTAPATYGWAAVLERGRGVLGRAGPVSGRAKASQDGGHHQ